VKLVQISTSRARARVCVGRDINEFKEGYKPRSKLIKEENGDLLPNFHSTLNRWKNCFSHVLNVHVIKGVR